ncbi:hypothetical protein EA187_13010 [Lujinxingia sediminis]|uniref:Outer membrane protein beta-barrel domain-containing protein n=1 Tax=Lujinxingia sediminis TaxID=2480984 RepID=A0ABY0CS72_9DELT|nr:hypothetical protein [Lujinxingia sediminis]RVU43128.1 hypothetical protein EA187_13010 [Lujinxingia sediminis]
MALRNVFLTTLIAALTLPALASAQYVDPNDSVRFESDLSDDEFMLTARARAVAVPGFLLGLFFDEHPTHWSEGNRNLSYGAEFVWRKDRRYELSAAFDYADLSMPEAFWQESGDTAQQAEWTELDMQVASVVFSAYWYWDVQEWFSPFVGGGIGPGIILGDIVRYQPRRNSPCYNNLGGGAGESFTPPECLTADGEPDPNAIDFDNPEIEDRVPPVVPIINISGGMRFNLGPHAVLKLEAGFYTYVFAGLSLGGQW